MRDEDVSRMLTLPCSLFHPKQPPRSGLFPPPQAGHGGGCFAVFLGAVPVHGQFSPHILSSCSRPWHGRPGGKMDSQRLQPGEPTSGREAPASDTR